MAIISIVILYLQEIKLFLAMFLMNILREGFETIIDPLFPLLNAPITPTIDFVLHIIIVGVEVLAFMKLFTIYKSVELNLN